MQERLAAHKKAGGSGAELAMSSVLRLAEVPTRDRSSRFGIRVINVV